MRSTAREAGRGAPLASLYRSYLTLAWQAHVVIAVAAAVMIYVQVVQAFFWNSGDPLDYYRTARFLLRLPGGELISQRPPGMALFLIASGVAWLDTFKIMIALYAAMSAAIPVLVYVALRRYSATWAMVAALVVTLGGVPYAYSRVGIPEQLFHFLHFVVLALAAAYFARPQNSRLPYAIALAFFALNLVRPVAALYYWIFLVCAVGLVRRPLRHVALATVMYMGLMGGWALADRYYGASLFPTVYTPETAAERLFGEVYFSGGQYQFVPERPLAAVLGAGDGPASGQFYTALRWLVSDPAQWTTPRTERPYLLFARFAGEPEGLVQAVVRRPNFVYFDFLRQALLARYGAAGAERVMYGVAAEHGNTGVRGIAEYFRRNPVKLLVGGLPPSGGRYLLQTFYTIEIRKQRNFFYSLGVSSPDLLSPDNGAASTEFFRSLDLFVHAYPGYWEHTNEWLSRYKGNPEGLSRNMFHHPDETSWGMYEGFYVDALSKYYGVGPADRLFSRVALETIRAYPHTIAIFWDNALHLALIRPLGDIRQQDGGPIASLRSVLIHPGDIVCGIRRNDPTGLTAGLIRELQPVIRCNKYVNAIGYAYGTAHQWAPVFVVAALVLLPFCLLGSARPLAVFLSAAYAYDLATDAVFGGFGAERYEDVFVLLPVMLACLGAHFAGVILTRCRRTPAAAVSPFAPAAGPGHSVP